MVNPRPGSRHETTSREDLLFSLLCEARHYLCDNRLYFDEHGGRRQRESNQEHANRISDNMERNEMLRDLLQRVNKAIQGEDDEDQDE